MAIARTTLSALAVIPILVLAGCGDDGIAGNPSASFDSAKELALAAKQSTEQAKTAQFTMTMDMGAFSTTATGASTCHLSFPFCHAIVGEMGYARAVSVTRRSRVRKHTRACVIRRHRWHCRGGWPVPARAHETPTPESRPLTTLACTPSTGSQ